MVDQLNNAIAELFADIDDAVEANQSRIKTRIVELLNKPNERLIPLWMELGVDKQLYRNTPATIEKANGNQHDDYWLFAISGLIAACKIQTFAEILARKLMSVFEEKKAEIEKNAKYIDSALLREHAKKGTPRSAFDAAKERYKNGAGNK